MPTPEDPLDPLDPEIIFGRGSWQDSRERNLQHQE